MNTIRNQGLGITDNPEDYCPMERKILTIMLAKVALLLADFRSSPGSLLMGEMTSGPIVDEYGEKTRIHG